MEASMDFSVPYLMGNIFDMIHHAIYDEAHSTRVWNGLKKKLSPEALDQFYNAFLSEQEGMETTLLQYSQYAFSNNLSIEKDYSHPAVLSVVQTAKKVWREKHRMEAFVRFQKLGDGKYFAPVEPDCNVLPIIAPHFLSRYANQ